MRVMLCVCLALLAWSNTGVGQQSVYNLKTRKFHFPVILAPEITEKVASVRLYYSDDRGRTWKLYNEYVMQKDLFIAFEAPDDGLYSFLLQTVFKDGTIEPRTSRNYVPEMWIRISTDPNMAIAKSRR
jgi:hypothetical protein